MITGMGQNQALNQFSEYNVAAPPQGVTDDWVDGLESLGSTLSRAHVEMEMLNERFFGGSKLSASAGNAPEPVPNGRADRIGRKLNALNIQAQMLFDIASKLNSSI